MNYAKEKRKVMILLIGGAFFAITVFYLLSVLGTGVYFTASFSGIFMFAAFMCYPLAIVYGKSQIADVFYSIRGGDRQAFRVKRGREGWGPIFKVLNFIIGVFVTLFFGWVYGTYTAYQKLQLLKSYQR